MIPLVIIAFWIGLYPKPFFQILSTPVNNLVATVRPDYPGSEQAGVGDAAGEFAHRRSNG